MFSNTLKPIFQPFLFLLIAVLSLSGCSSSDDNTDDYGYVQFYNASPNSPVVELNVDDVSYGSEAYTGSTSRIEFTSGSTNLVLSWQEDSNDDVEIFDDDISVTDYDVSLFVLAGDFDSPDILQYKFAHDADSLTDGDGEDNFALRIINADADSAGFDIYISADNETFNEAVYLSSLYYTEISDAQYLEVDGYKVYLTEVGGSDPIYESDEIRFYNNDEYVLAVRPNSGAQSTPYSIDMITAITSAEYPPLNANAELRFYNGLSQTELLPTLGDSIDLKLVSDNNEIDFSDLTYGQLTDNSELESGDYAVSIFPQSNSEPIASNHFLSLSHNQSTTLFLYHTEVTEENDDGSETTTLYINSQPVDNSSRVSLYDHQLNLMNLVQDDDFGSVRVYFVRSNETVDTANYQATAVRANPKTIVLPNNTYTISVIATVNNSDILLVSDELSLDSTSGDLFLVIRTDDASATGYSVDYLAQDPAS